MEVPADQNILPLILLGSFGALLISASVVFFFFRYQKRVQQQKEKLLTTELAYKQELLQVNIRSQEEERMRISKELHDNIGGSLSTLRFLTRQLGNAVDQSDEAQTLTQKYSGMIDDVINDVRNISHSLTPPGLAIWGLQEALEALGEKVSSASGIQITVYCDNEHISKLPYDHALAIYRVIQELLTNTLKHAFARSVQVTINGNEQLVRCSYSDDGIGVDTFEHKDRGIGLQNIENRILMAHGTYHIETAKDKGFTFTLAIPLTTEDVA